MHDIATMNSLMRKIATLANVNKAQRVTAVRVKLGALAGMDANHFREHFEAASRGTVAEGAATEAQVTEDLFGVFLVDIEVES